MKTYASDISDKDGKPYGFSNLENLHSYLEHLVTGKRIQAFNLQVTERTITLLVIYTTRWVKMTDFNAVDYQRFCNRNIT